MKKKVYNAQGKFVPNPNGRPRVPVVKRFWLQVIKQAQDGCWLWIGYRVPKMGYGRIGTTCNPTRGMYAHRFSWELHKGLIPKGLCVLHRCDVPWCVNPDHLFLGTKAENNLDCAKKGRESKGENHPHSMLTDELVTQIRKLYVPFKFGPERIAAKLGISCVPAVRWVTMGRSWKHVK